MRLVAGWLGKVKGVVEAAELEDGRYARGAQTSYTMPVRSLFSLLVRASCSYQSPAGVSQVWWWW